jgi:hypothetical protein
MRGKMWMRGGNSDERGKCERTDERGTCERTDERVKGKMWICVYK